MALLVNDIVSELKELVRQRGEISRAQVEYARAEFQALKEMFPISKPSDEIRLSFNRTLHRYLGDQAVKNLVEGREG